MITLSKYSSGTFSNEHLSWVTGGQQIYGMLIVNARLGRDDNDNGIDDDMFYLQGNS